MDLRALASCLLLAALVTSAQAAGAEPLGRARRGSPQVAVHYIGHDAGEPTLGVDKESRVFYAAAKFDLQGLPQIDVMRSTDSGESWDIASPRLGDRNVHVISGDPYVYVDGSTGRAFTVDLQGYNCSLLSFTDDAGESWITNPAA